MKLTNILNSILRLHHFPKSWKHTHIILIPKPQKDLTFPQNFRPIRLLSTVSKIEERTILTRLQNEIDNNQATPNYQFGFRGSHNTVMQLTRVTDKNTKNFKFLKPNEITSKTPIIPVKIVDEVKNPKNLDTELNDRESFLSVLQVIRFVTKTFIDLFPFEKQRVQTALEHSVRAFNFQISHSGNKIHFTFNYFFPITPSSFTPTSQ